MTRSLTIRWTLLLVAVVIALLMVSPRGAHAQQSTNDLRATIKSELLSDPRTLGLSQAEIDAMVNILAQEAQKNGMTVHDITWRPQIMQSAGMNAGGDVAMAFCAPSSILCKFNEAFGFVGPDTIIPFTLGSASMGLVWILAEMLHRRSRLVIPRAGSQVA